LQVSDDVKLSLGERYLLEERGTTEIKNRGAIKTWVVNGRAAIKPDKS
jgi:hypothetical protein